MILQVPAMIIGIHGEGANYSPLRGLGDGDRRKFEGKRLGEKVETRIPFVLLMNMV